MGKNNRAYSLIEVLVVCGILLAAYGVVSAQYNTYTQQRKLRDEAKKITSTLNLAGQRAAAGDSGSSCDDYRGFSVTVATTGTYTTRRCCESACSSSQSIIQSQETLPLGLSFLAPATATSYLFKSLTREVTVSPAGNQTITLRNALIGRCISLVVSPSGVITQQAETSC